MTNLAGQVALVTGAGQGVGQGIAFALAAAGAAVAVTGRTEAKIAETAQDPYRPWRQGAGDHLRRLQGR